MGVVVVLLAAAVAAVLARDSIAAQLRAGAVLTTTLDTPLLAPAVARLTDAPRFEEAVIDGVPTTIAVPGGAGPWPAVVFANGATLEGRRHPTVRRLAEGLARTGHLVLVPDVPGLATGELSGATLRGLVATGRSATRDRRGADDRVAFVGVSVGAALGLLAAEDPELRSRTSVVAGIAPYTDVTNVVRLATTGTYRAGRRVRAFDTAPFLPLVVGRSLVAALPPGRDRQVLTGVLATVATGGVQALTPAQLSALATLSPGARAVVELFLNRDPARFDALYAALPADVQANLELLSPIAGERQLRARVELTSAPRDKYFPLYESQRLVRRGENRRLTVTGALAHADLSLSLEELPDVSRLNGFVVRTLRAAREG